MQRLTILVLHNLGNPDLAPTFLQHHVYCLREAYPHNVYFYHDVALPLPDYVANLDFDAIVLDVTFLALRWSEREHFETTRRQYDFVRESSAVKIALPQDEYDCNELLDEWLVDWNVDCVISVIPTHWPVLYPTYHRVGRIELGFTGCINSTLLTTQRRPHHARRIDIGYRTRKLPPYFGRVGQTKWTIGRDVERLARREGLTTDIVVGDKGTLHGQRWLDFVNDCRFTLGANSGSSLLDPRGDIQRSVRQYLAEHPGATFEQVEQHCFAGLEGHFHMTAISPRVIEAALLDSCQILVEGDYSGLLTPWEHYIPIRPDASDFPEVLRAMRDPNLVQTLIHNCRNTIVECKELAPNSQADHILGVIAEERSFESAADNQRAQAVSQQYQEETAPAYRSLWRRQARRRSLVAAVDRFPVMSRLVRRANNLRKALTLPRGPA